ncbi:MAG: hypothetical protein RR630_10500 [Coprobacillus sp.]
MRKYKVNIVSLSKKVNEVLTHQNEMIQVVRDGRYRPFIILLRLNYKGKNYTFALPLRSNIGKAPIETYFPLPNRKVTKDNRKHGLHYIKMIPIDSKFFSKYFIGNSVEERYLISYIEKHLDIIIKESQLYLKNYEKGKRYKYCIDIDDIIKVLNL